MRHSPKENKTSMRGFQDDFSMVSTGPSMIVDRVFIHSRRELYS